MRMIIILPLLLGFQDLEPLAGWCHEYAAAWGETIRASTLRWEEVARDERLGPGPKPMLTRASSDGRGVSAPDAGRQLLQFGLSPSSSLDRPEMTRHKSTLF